EECSTSWSEIGCGLTSLRPGFLSIYTYEIPFDTKYVVTPKIVSKSGVLESQTLKISKSWRLSVPAINC
ncbi:hypothetical protein, partial [Oleiphilus sp. HI0066]|uniref:hypothetical protein n=2 Tax=Oleiphilus TaxID=141450 RepID=UPI000B1F3C62